ncbi:hypothetical protein [Mucilaginibacter sp.]
MEITFVEIKIYYPITNQEKQIAAAFSTIFYLLTIFYYYSIFSQLPTEDTALRITAGASLIIDGRRLYNNI